ncbi:MarR family winged helix-turn-helix transcriptional regulator [Mycobacterium sp. E796]|uniref:MarR family winged helix-turn-helix transcriptional regulator n=1 Tax=Mycobacterium sp. E796 TaxID=1834151 RepID=UPI0009EE42E6|nr:MarR family transcriptional regulator [Mycobacterium sp. E796]
MKQTVRQAHRVPPRPAADLDRIRYLILGAQREGGRMMATSLRETGLTPAQAEVLEVVKQHGPLTLAELGKRLVCETGSPSRLVDTLVQRGYISRERGEEDRRTVTLTLTALGDETVDEVVKHGGLRDHIAAHLTPQEIGDLTALLRKLLTDTSAGDALALRFPAEGG